MQSLMIWKMQMRMARQADVDGAGVGARETVDVK
jgi:hypothetical protein